MRRTTCPIFIVVVGTERKRVWNVSQSSRVTEVKVVHFRIGLRSVKSGRGDGGGTRFGGSREWTRKGTKKLTRGTKTGIGENRGESPLETFLFLRRQKSNGFCHGP